jgi:hypothetical protein
MESNVLEEKQSNRIGKYSSKQPKIGMIDIVSPDLQTVKHALRPQALDRTYVARVSMRVARFLGRYSNRTSCI